jgi:hypothetical protein
MNRNGSERAGAIVEPNLQDPDGFYECLIEAHEGLGIEESFELNVRLLMLLANQIGDPAILSDCIRLARESGGTRNSTRPGETAAIDTLND